METAPRQYVSAVVNITNRCTLRCAHCFVYRDSNPNAPGGEMDSATMIAKLAELKKRHGLQMALWMGGEPLLRPDVLREGVKLFPKNHVTTNGSIDLIELPNTIYVVSLDGPPDINDKIRGKGSFDRVMKTLANIPDGFGPTVMVQCVVTRTNEDRLEELGEILRGTKAQGMTFSFYVPRAKDDTGLAWESLERRDVAVREALRLKEKYPDFIWNNRRSLELTLSDKCLAVTRDCPSKKFVLPLYLDGNEFVTPFCCYGNDVNCDMCGAWVVFYIAAKIEKFSPSPPIVK